MEASPTEIGRSADAVLAPERLEHLFSAVVQFTSESHADAVIPADGREGEYLGSGNGTVTGNRVQGTIQWSFYSGNCLYPRIRRGERVDEAFHLCTLNPGGFIDTQHGARIRFDGKGYGLRSPDRYRLGMTLAFRAEDARYAWLEKVLGLMQGDFDERAGRATWTVYTP